MFVSPWRLLGAIFCAGALVPATAALPVPEAGPFFEDHCVECHDKGTAKGGLDLEALGGSLETPAEVERWTSIFDRMASGEMPPKKKARPASRDLARVLSAIRPALITADRAGREVVQRRLNREEYQNTVRDLLGIETVLKGFLPEDQRAGGFDNNGAALAISTEQMQGYLEAARVAVDEVLNPGKPPVEETVSVDSLPETQRYIDSGEYGFVDGRVVLFTTHEGTYSKVSTRAKRTPARGFYRFRFSAVALNTTEPQVFSVTISDNALGSTLADKNLGYFDATSTPKTFEIVARLGAKSAIQFFPLGLPEYLKNPAASSQPGIAFGSVEMTGPLADHWPPEGFQRLFGGLDPSKLTGGDAETILRGFMPKAFRRPVEEAEVARSMALVKTRMAAGRSGSESLRSALVAVLCSPNFLYMREESGATRIRSLELASRLSYFLWSSMPDAELLALGQSGKLLEPKVLDAQIERLLGDKKSDALVSNFTGQWLRLRAINDTTPDPKLYKKFDELLQVSMVREGEGFFRELLTADLPLSNLLDSDFAMLNGRLARHYGIPGVSGFEMRKVKLPADSVRGGVLTQAGVLKVTANGTATSPVTRGVWVLENILGQRVPPPPPNTAGLEPDIRGATTVREQLAKHRTVESCNACHRNIDPPGFALESFDPIGDFREHYLRFVVSNPEKGWGNVQPGAKVDSTGQLASGEPFADVRDLKKLLLARRAEFTRCLTEKLMTYALGREMGFSDRAELDQIAVENQSKGNGLRSLIHAIVRSETFSRR